MKEEETELRIDWLINEMEATRDRDINFQKSLDTDEAVQYFYLEGRISALSDVLLQYYFRKRGV